MSRQTRAIIHAQAIINNFNYMQSLAPNSQSMAVIKADAYGHGAVNVATVLAPYSPRFAVAIMEEALALRAAGITAPIVVLEGPHQPKECEQAGVNHCILLCHNREQLAWIKSCGHPKPNVWIKVDTGMHRLGFHCDDVMAVTSEYAELLNHNSVLATHLACADDTQNLFSELQLKRFFALSEQLSLPVSIANSPATFAWPSSRGDWNRIGIAIYGGAPMAAQTSDQPLLTAAMTLTSQVIAVRRVAKGEGVGYGQTWVAQRDSLVATVGIGYADGYPRHCPNGTPVFVKGRPAHLVGRVSMDMITIDVTHVADVAVGDEVELWGRNVSIDEVAAHAGTISYELMTRVSPRVPRVLDNQK